MNLQKKKFFHKFIASAMSLAMVLGLCASFQVSTKRVNGADAAFESSISGFSDSYKPYLRTLHSQYPNWKFVPYQTGLDFSTVVNKECENNKSLIENAYSIYLKSNASGDYNSSKGNYIAKDGGSWVSASKNAVAYFLDPRNFLNPEQIYMFEQLSFDAATQSQAGVEAVLQGSFMANTAIGYITTQGKYKTSDILYSRQILDAGRSANVSAYYIASKIIQEIGKKKNSKYAGMGESGSVSGTYSKKYTGIYNFYNIGAYSGKNPIANGLEWASTGKTYQRPWNTPFKSIAGGAEYIGEKYINCGQNTIYLQRFNVNKNSRYSLYDHQYMTNIYGAASEATFTSEAYNSLGIASLAKTFVIPVYLNMPNESNVVRLGSAANKTGRTLSTVNVRKGPSTDYATIITLAKDDVVTVTQGVLTNAQFGTKWLSNPYWYKVKINKNGKSYEGYIASTYVTLNSEYTITKGVRTQIPVNLSNYETVYYMSDNPAIATVDAAGYVTGMKGGTVTIRVFTQGGSMSATTVTVSEKGCVLNCTKVKLQAGENKKLKATVYPTDSTNKTVQWSSSNKAVAKVTKKGKIKSVAPGTAVITAKAAIGGVAGTCTVTVVPKKPVVSAKGKKGAVKLKWTKMKNVTAYQIYRKKGKGKYKLIAKIKGTAGSYKNKKLKKGKKYTYRVRAYTLVGKKKYKSKKSSAVTVKVK